MPGITKKRIAEAYLALADHKPVDKITVKDLVEECGITRQTFYYHFRDLPEVLEWMVAQFTRALLDKTLDQSPQAAMRILVGEVTAQASLLDKLMHSRRREDIERLFLGAVRSYLMMVMRQSPVLGEFSVDDLGTTLTFYSWGIAGLLIESCQRPNADLDALADQLWRLVSGQMLPKHTPCND
ncbi:MAG: TetR family transcriptional regulator [Peptococcaceae bacterium]|nr:TetR family transcriptional regulator [Peptococcaceae bacterium]